MDTYRYSAFEVWFVPIVLMLLFVFYFIRSLFLLGDFFAANPLFEKKRTKHLAQWTSLVNISSPILIAYYVFLVFEHDNEEKQDYVSYLPIVYILLFLFLRIIENYLNREALEKENTNQTISSSGMFILAFIPVSTCATTSKNLIDFLLPLEMIGVMLYFVLLEFAYTNQTSENSKRLELTTVTKGFLYYFWLNFIGTAAFVSAILIICLQLPNTSYKLLNYYYEVGLINNIFVWIIALFIFIALSVKMGGLFFFFFKADLYKLLPINGILLFSIFSTFFYLIVFYFLSLNLSFLLFFFKYYICAMLTVMSVVFLYMFGINQKNIYVFAGLSSVVSLIFCILVIL